MPDIQMQLVPWDPCTSVGAYSRVSEQMPEDQPPTGVSVVQTAIVASDDSLTYLDLPDGDYWATAPAGGVWRYVAFSVRTVEPGIPGPTGKMLITGWPSLL